MRQTVCIELPRDPRCGALARRALIEHVGASLDERALLDAKLVVSELVNNAFLHGSGVVEMMLTLDPGRLRIEVLDEGRGAAIEIRSDGDPVAGGRGLRVVQQLSAVWGAKPGTTHVWADLPLQVAN